MDGSRDEFETEIGWTDVSEAREAEPAKPTSTADGTGMPANSLSRMPTFLDAEPTEEEAPKQRQAAAAPPPAPVNNRELAGEIVTALMTAQQLQTQQQQRGPHPGQVHQQVKQQMVEKGADTEAVNYLEKFVETKLQEKAAAHQEQARDFAVQQFAQSVDGVFEEAIDNIYEAIPELGQFAPSVREKAREIWQSDPEFADHYRKMSQGVVPPKRIANKVAVKAGDAISKAAGIAKLQASVSLQSNQPARSTAGGTNTRAGADSLDRTARAYYDALIDDFGPKEAMRRTKNLFR